MDETTMRSTHNAYFNLPQISLSTRLVHILPLMKDRYLISIIQLCDDCFAVNFDTKNSLLKKVNDVLTRYIDAITGLNIIYFDKPQPLTFVSNQYLLSPPTPSHSPSNTLANSMQEMFTKMDLVLYLHQSAWIPVP